jgi:2-oxoisovalerate ferredoxin oxidoreductase alpha subunit
MISRSFAKGNEAVAYGALKAGLVAYFAYPITPSSEIPETLAKEFGNPAYPRFKAFLQAASKIEAINMVIGAAATGERVMTATSGPGFSLKQEAISFAAGMEIPLLVVDINRSGPGLGNLGPEQSDYNQAVKGGGHEDYHPIVLAPNSVQEMADFSSLGFDLAFQYRNPVLILADAFLGQCKEDIVFPETEPKDYDVSWATRGSDIGKRHILTSIHFDHDEQEQIERGLQQKFDRIREKEPRCEAYMTDDAEVVIVAYGIVSRICKGYVNEARKRGLRLGLLRPITRARIG